MANLSFQNSYLPLLLVLQILIPVNSNNVDGETIVHPEYLHKVQEPDRSKLQQIFKYIDDNEYKFLDRLREAVAIPSVSCSGDTSACVKMASWTASKLDALGFKTELLELGIRIINGENAQLPPVVLGTLGRDPAKKTLLVYGHLDVQPAKLSDGWDTDPFNLTEIRNNLYGRGATDDKGQVISWINAIEAYVKSGLELPVNIKVVYECMEECGSLGLAEGLKSVRETFLNDIDSITISDSYWLGTRTPSLVYGLRGLVYFFVEVEGGGKDLHSGSFGGAVQEALPDLIWLMDRLVDVNGNILIKKVMDKVHALTPEESKLYDNLDFDLNTFKSMADVRGLIHSKSKVATLMARWRYPSLSIHGIEGAFSDPGSKTVIPRKVIGKFSIRTVPDQTPDKVGKIVKEYLEELWTERKSANKLKVTVLESAKPWLTSIQHPSYVAAAKANEVVYGVKPQYTREGGSIPITLVLEELTGKTILHLPLGQSDDGAHSQNEKISKRNYILGSKVVAAYLNELGKIKTNP